jgi:hypothetical protein
LAGGSRSPLIRVYQRDFSPTRSLSRSGDGGLIWNGEPSQTNARNRQDYLISLGKCGFCTAFPQFFMSGTATRPHFQSKTESRTGFRKVGRTWRASSTSSRRGKSQPSRRPDAIRTVVGCIWLSVRTAGRGCSAMPLTGRVREMGLGSVSAITLAQARAVAQDCRSLGSH